MEAKTDDLILTETQPINSAMGVENQTTGLKIVPVLTQTKETTENAVAVEISLIGLRTVPTYVTYKL